MLVEYSIPKSTPIPMCELLYDASHVLIGGTTGSGKSVLIDDYIYSLLGYKMPFKNSSNSVQFVLIDPKKVSLVKYRTLPHTIRYATENNEIIDALDYVIETMDARYNEMAQFGMVKWEGTSIIVIIDELADLMVTYQKQIMPRLQRIAQLGRASAIKLVCATQCPNRIVVPAELTVNFTGRVALRCLDKIESKQIIKRNGAESLPMHGKALYLHSDSKYYELNVPLLSDAKIQERIDMWLSQTPQELINQRLGIFRKKKKFSIFNR